MWKNTNQIGMNLKGECVIQFEEEKVHMNQEFKCEFLTSQSTLLVPGFNIFALGFKRFINDEKNR